MTKRHLFSNDEWQTLQFLPLTIAGMVSISDGEIDEREGYALGQLLGDPTWCSDPFVGEVLSSVAANYMPLAAAYAHSPLASPEGLEEAARVLDAHLSPAEAESFKKRMMDLGTWIARASGDAGPQDIDSIDEEEYSTLLFVAGKLGVS